MSITATQLAQGRLAQYDSSHVPHSFDAESVFVRVEFFNNTDPKVVAILRSPAHLAPAIAHKLE